MVLKIVFFFTVLSIIGNSHKGVHCFQSAFLNKYIAFDENNLNSFNWLCHDALYRVIKNNVTDTANVLEYYTGLIRVHNDGTYAKQSDCKLRWLIGSDTILKEAEKWYFYSIYITERHRTTEIFNQCSKILNLLIMPTKKVSEYVQLIANERLIFDEENTSINPVPIALKFGHILLLLKNEEEDKFINSSEEDQTLFIFGLMKEALVNILDGMNHVLKNISKKDPDQDYMKLKLLNSMYKYVCRAVWTVYVITRIVEIIVLGQDSVDCRVIIYDLKVKIRIQKQFRHADSLTKYSVQCNTEPYGQDDFLEAYVSFRKYFLYKWKNIDNHTSNSPELPTMLIGEGRLIIKNDTGVNIRISVFGYYHFMNIGIDIERQEYKDIIGNEEVHFLLDLKLWLLMVYQFGVTMKDYCINKYYNSVPRSECLSVPRNMSKMCQKCYKCETELNIEEDSDSDVEEDSYIGMY